VNGAYYNSVSSKMLKYKEPICISECLKSRPLMVYKYIWEDSNQKGWDEFVSPMAEDLAYTFNLTKEKDGMYTTDGIALGLGIELLKRIETIENKLLQEK
jgi:hypothetical protein